MVALSDTVRASNRTDTGTFPTPYAVFLVATGAILRNMAITAIYDGSGAAGREKGKAGPWTNAPDEIPAGLHVGEKTTGDGVLGSMTQIDGARLDQVTVTGSGSSLPGTPVYCATDNPDDLTVTPPSAGSKPVGKLYRKLQPSDTSNLDWAVVLNGLVPNKLLTNEEGEGPRVAALTATGTVASGSVADSPEKYTPITAASTATITLSAPTAAELGNVAYYVRVGGAGVPTVAFTHEDGSAISRVLADGEVLKIKALTTDGWRVLA